MRRVPGFLFAVAVMVLGLIASVGLISGASAQDASPPAGGPPPGVFEIAPGVTADAAVFAEGRQDPSLYRLTFAPGVMYPIAESPALELAYVESGALAMTLSVPVTIGEVGSPGVAGESVEANTEFTLEAGQYIVLPPGTTGEVRNDGDEPGVVSVANIIPTSVGTPEATPGS
jgi:hypothetical protein